MSREQRFVFTFEVGNQFLRGSPVADRYVELAKARIAGRCSAVGPRGGLYRLVSPPDCWRESDDCAFTRNMRTFGTKRIGRYVRPDRITPDLRLGDTLTFDELTIPVDEGRALLPDDSTVETPSTFIVIPVLTSPTLREAVL